jgi:hypothetical protein
MKKLGTPIGAGPGSESEKVGLEDFGTPLPVGRLTFGFLAFCDVVVVVVVVWVWLEPFCCLCRVGFGGVAEGVVELELDEEDEDEPECELDPECEPEPDELELEELELEELELDLVGEEVVVEDGGEEVVVEDGGGAAGAQVSDSTTAPTGSATDEIGAPATIGKVTVWPVTSFTVSVQLLAEALGRATAIRPASRAPASVIEKISFRLNNNSARLLLPAPCASLTP